MKTYLFEATNDFNWGKFLVGRMDHERMWLSGIDVDRLVLHPGRWAPNTVWVLDLETKEGAAFVPGGSARADLDKHKIWVCPMFEPFLEWLYRELPAVDFNMDALPNLVQLPDAKPAFAGYRRGGVGDHE